MKLKKIFCGNIWIVCSYSHIEYKDTEFVLCKTNVKYLT